MLVRWPFTSRPQAVHASFVSALPSFLPKLPRLPEYEARGRWREGLLLHYKAWALQEPTLADLEQGRLQTVVPVFAPKDDSNVDERVVTVPAERDAGAVPDLPVAALGLRAEAKRARDPVGEGRAGGPAVRDAACAGASVPRRL